MKIKTTTLIIGIVGLIASALLFEAVRPKAVSAQGNLSTPAPPATLSTQSLYVGDDNTPGSVLQYTLPLSASSTSNFAIASNNVVSVGQDANGNLAVGDNAGHLQFFTTPLSGASTPAATFNNGAASNNGNMSFLNTGDFWAATVSNRVNRFNSPFSNASTPAAFVTDAGMVSDIGTAIDAAQNLYISNAGTGNAAACAGTSSPGGGCGSNIYVYAPPYTGAPIITPNVINYPFGSASTAYRKIAVNATRLYAASVSNAPGRVDVYNLPITAASAPAFNLQTGVNTPEGLALDPAGNLYIGNLSDATITVYTAPITAGSVPSLIYKVSTGSFAIFGIAIGTSPTPAASVQFSTAIYSLGEGGGSAVITVTRTGDTSGTSTVDFATSDGTASQRTDYTVTAGTLTFSAGDISKTFAVPLVNDAYPEANKTVNLTLSNAVGATLGSPSTAVLTILDNDGSGSTPQKRFAAALTGAQETPPSGSSATGQGYVLLNASETSAQAGLVFTGLSSTETGAQIHGPGVGVPAPTIFTLPTTNPVTNFAFSPTTQQVSDLKAGLHYMNVNSNNFTSGETRGQLLWNPTLEENFFVRQTYLDFLGREPDASGFSFWTGTITPCAADAVCLHNNTVSTSDAFFFEPEFHQTAGFVFLVYRAAYGNMQPFPNPDGSNPTEANKLPNYNNFVADRARVVGGGNLTTSQQAFTNLLVTRPEFVTRYPLALTGPLFVSALLTNIQIADGADLSSQQAVLVTQYNNAGGGNAGRGMVLFSLALDDAVNNPVNNRAFVNAEYNRQFALTLYFGYLRRNPDIGGFLFWQGQINTAAVGSVPKQQALVCSYITSMEYQLRFGPNAPRSNAECPP